METQQWKEIAAEKYEFKSYYVVWKLVEKDDCTRGKNSLNRTMQYGNLRYYQILLRYH